MPMNKNDIRDLIGIATLLLLLVAAAPCQTTPIQHVVILIKENHSFDSLFGTFPGANGATSGMTSNGSVIPLSHASDTPPNFSHTWQMFILAEHGGKMDRFDKTPGCGTYACYTQYQQPDIPNYWAYAQQYVLADNFFSSSNGPSFPNHQYFIASQSGGAVNNPQGVTLGSWGCDAKAAVVQTFDLATKKYGKTVPCFDYLTLGDVLDAAGVSWQYYAPTAKVGGYIWSAYDAIRHVRYGADWENVRDQKNFELDALAGRLAAVNWVTVDWNESDHPSASLTKGENRAVSIVNAVMQGPDWPTTAIFITWDDPGGFYDHVPPPYIDGYGAGMRVPLLAISPYVTPQVYHEQATIDSLLAFVEANWQLPSLTIRDASANNLMDLFNWNAKAPALALRPRPVPKMTERTKALIRKQQRDGKESEGDER